MYSIFILLLTSNSDLTINHLMRLFSAGILWRQLLASLLSFVQVCFRLIKEDTAAAVVSLCVSSQLLAAPVLSLHPDLESGHPPHQSSICLRYPPFP